MTLSVTKQGKSEAEDYGQVKDPTTIPAKSELVSSVNEEHSFQE